MVRPLRLAKVALALAGLLGPNAAHAAGDDTPAAREDAALVATPDAAQATHDAAYESWFARRNRTVHGERIVLESLGVLVVGTAYYWSDPLGNKEDWEDPAVTDKLRFRHRAASFDTNLNPTNHLLHPGSGAFTYGLARDNGLSVAGSTALTFASSFLWEFGLEWRERASYNDLVFTTFGGVVLGNFFHRLGEYVNSAPANGNVPRAVASWALGAPRKVHAALDDEPRPDALPPDELGFSSAFTHRFRVGYELASLRNDVGASGAIHRVDLDGELAAMPGMGRPGAFVRRFGEANFTDMRVRLGFGEGGDGEADIEGFATLAGEYRQSYVRDGDGRLRGHATMIGFGPGWRYQGSQWLGRRDQLSTIHVLGPHFTGWLAGGLLGARLDASAHGDFASPRSLAYEIFPEPDDPTRIKWVLERQGYQYAMGWSARARAAVSLGPLALEGRLAYGRYGSIEGHDRRQSRITTEVHGTEEVLESAVALRARVAGVVELGVGASERRRWSALGPYEVSRWDRALSASAGLVF